VKKIQWNAFLRKNRFDEEKKDLGIIIDVLRDFLMPPLSALANKHRIFSNGGQPVAPGIYFRR
jgi:hypothetical protein